MTYCSSNSRRVPRIREFMKGINEAYGLRNRRDSRFNQTVVSYDATKEEKVEALKRRQGEIEERLREKKGLGSP